MAPPAKPPPDPEKDAGIISRQKRVLLLKELFRKAIHLCAAFVPPLLWRAKTPTLIALACVTVLFCIEELLRLRGKEMPLISAVTEAAARRRDENRFVLGPVTLSCGIIITALVWEKVPAAIGIYALAFGDGLASLAGCLFSKVRIPFTDGKTAAGSLTCFAAIFISCWAVCRHFVYGQVNVTKVALIIAACGTAIEILPLKDFDNLLLPVALGGIAQRLLA